MAPCDDKHMTVNEDARVESPGTWSLLALGHLQPLVGLEVVYPQIIEVGHSFASEDHQKLME